MSNQHLDTIKFVVYVLGGVLLYMQFVMANRRARAMEKSVHMQIQTNELVRKGQLAQRFKDAVDQLGHERMAVRLGAIYSLHHLASDNETYRSTVHKIFCAFLRSQNTSFTAQNSDGLSPNKGYGPQEQFGNSLAEDLQAILNLIACNEVERHVYAGLKINLKMADLSYADLSKADLRYAQLSSANLSGANLYKANLSKTILYNTNLTQVKALYINLNNAYIGNANFEQANLRGAKLQNVDINTAHLETANLSDVDFSKDDSSH